MHIVSVDIAKKILSKKDNTKLFQSVLELANNYAVPYNHGAFDVVIHKGVLVGLMTAFDRLPCIRDIRLKKVGALTLENG